MTCFIFSSIEMCLGLRFTIYQAPSFHSTLLNNLHPFYFLLNLCIGCPISKIVAVMLDTYIG